jgi:hypothetical protein
VGSAWARREEKESRERCGEDWVGHHPFIGGVGGGGGIWASWPASMPWLDGVGYQSQEGEGVSLRSIHEVSS